VYALLPDKETNTYTKMWSTIGSLVKYKEGPTSDGGVVSDFEEGVMNNLSMLFHHAQV
jgi:hypothetical protein